MNRRGILTALLLIATVGMWAQDWSSPELESMLRTYVKQVFEVNGKVYGVDEYEPEPYPLQSATVRLICMGDTTSMDGATADKDGLFWTYITRRDRLKDTRVRLVISYLGM